MRRGHRNLCAGTNIPRPGHIQVLSQTENFKLQRIQAWLL